MAILRGSALGMGFALGTATLVRLRGGALVPPSIPPRIAAQMARRSEEKPDVILVAEDYMMAAAFSDSIQWANVVGIAAASAPPDAIVTSTLPVVAGVAGLLENIQDDMLLIVDADRGLVVTDPDGIVVAQYQAKRNNLAPKRRLYLDEGHLVAQTIDGHTVQVFARVSTLDDLTTALHTGADALYIPSDCELLPVSAEAEGHGGAADALLQMETEQQAEDDVQHRQLVELVRLAGGKPLLLADNYDISAQALLETAAMADITVFCPLMPHLEGQGVGELGQELNEVRADCLANDELCDMPRLALEIPANHPLPLDDPEQATFYADRLAYNGATRLLVTLEDEQINAESLAWLGGLVAAANTVMLPVIAQWLLWAFSFGGEDTSEEPLEGRAQNTLCLLIGAGIGSLIVAASDVTKMKTAIRNANHADCRETLRAFLKETAQK
jgi:phosphohistidine swiveling domain-containing protein